MRRLKRPRPFLAAAVLAALLAGRAFSQAPGIPAVAQVYFSPHGGCGDAVIGVINGAAHRLRMEAYDDTSVPIALALIGAMRRLVEVDLLVDDGNETDKNSVVPFLKANGAVVRVDVVSGIAHNKVLIADEDTVETGSYNYTAAAEEKNAENVLILKSPELAAAYSATFDARWAHGREFVWHGKGPALFQ